MFIAIEGTDGSGKGTQTNLLVEALKKDKVNTYQLSFPQYGQASAAPVEAYLRGEFGNIDEVGPRQASVFYAVDRFAAAKEIRNKISQNTLVITDRYVMSNMAHQGGKIDNDNERNNYFAWNNELEFGTMNIPKPDVTVLLYMPAEVSYKLIEKKAQREYTAGKKRDLHEADIEHLKKAESVYLKIADSYPNIKIINCAPDGQLRTMEDIHKELFKLVRSVIIS